MLIHPPPVSNNERQRQFRARNPGYNRRYRHRGNADEARATWMNPLVEAEALQQSSPLANQTQADGDQLLLFPI